MKLLGRLILRPLARDLARTLLTVLAVALGVAVVVAIDLAGDAATGSFHSSMETLSGKTDMEILANGGIDEKWVGVLDSLPVNAAFAPMVEAQGIVEGVGSVPIYGVDFVANAPGGMADGPEGAAISSALANRLHLKIPGPLEITIGGRERRIDIGRVVGAAPAEFLAVDIADAQQLLGRYGKLDRIDVTVAPSENFVRVEKAVRAALPAGYLIEKPGVRNEENQRMVRAFRWNLRVLGYISLVVGAFLIYNTIAVSVVRRRAEIGTLRAVGASRGTVFGLFLTEALILGATGSVVGVALGRVLAAGVVGMIAQTVNALYTSSRPTPVELTAGEAWTGLLTGVIVALVSAWKPSREAIEVPPTEAMSRGAHEHRSVLRWRRSLVWAAACATASGAMSLAPAWKGYPVGGYISALLAIAAMAFASPAVVLAAGWMTRGITRKRAESLLAGLSLTASLARTAVVVSALATAIAMMASVGIMVASFRETVALWLDVQLRADLYVRSAMRSGAGEYPPMDARIPALLASIPGVAAVDDFRATEFHDRGERATLGAGNMDIVRRYGRLRFLGGEYREAILRSLPGRDRAVVSEPFALKHKIHAGDRLTVAIGGQMVELTVAGIYYDYSSSQGYVIVDKSTMLKYLPDLAPTNAAVYLAPGADAESVRREIQLRTAEYGIAVARNSELRRASIEIFDRTFAITWALEAVAILVAMLGAANSLLALVLDRRRELGLVRFLGGSAKQVRGMILTEAAFLGLLAAILGVALGLALSLLLIYVVNRQSFGWTIQFHMPVGLLAAAVVSVWLVTVLAGIYPARVAARMSPIEAIQEE
ncbi:MAG TPA: FtsX-like permease family protein [Bryobacteraceae bacterium]|nr:FtsX-like permease family protein [Bryobacteraceae bacterium]